jgi:hypothetical protein
MKPARMSGQWSLVGGFEVSNYYVDYVDRSWWLKLGSLLTNWIIEYLNTAYFRGVHLLCLPTACITDLLRMNNTRAIFVSWRRTHCTVHAFSVYMGHATDSQHSVKVVSQTA